MYITPRKACYDEQLWISLLNGIWNVNYDTKNTLHVVFLLSCIMFTTKWNSSLIYSRSKLITPTVLCIVNLPRSTLHWEHLNNDNDNFLIHPSKYQHTPLDYRLTVWKSRCTYKLMTWQITSNDCVVQRLWIKIRGHVRSIHIYWAK